MVEVMVEVEDDAAVYGDVQILVSPGQLHLCRPQPLTASPSQRDRRLLRLAKEQPLVIPGVCSESNN